MDPALLREIKLKPAAKSQKFWGLVSEAVSLGRPLAWSVQLGLVDETPKLPQVMGGHMRLIIGFNPE